MTRGQFPRPESTTTPRPGRPNKTIFVAIFRCVWFFSSFVQNVLFRCWPWTLLTQGWHFLVFVFFGSLVSKDGRSYISRILMPSPYPIAGLCPKTLLHLDLAIPPDLRGIGSRSSQQSVFGSTNATDWATGAETIDPWAHMCKVKLLGRGVQIFFSGRGMLKICSGRGRNCFIQGGGREGDFSSKTEPTIKKENITFTVQFFKKNTLICWKKILIFWKENLKFFHVFWQLREGVALESFKNFLLGALWKASGRGTY